MKDGKLIVCNDEWVFSDAGFNKTPDTAKFLNNVLNWFCAGHDSAESSDEGEGSEGEKKKGNFLVFFNGIAYQGIFKKTIEEAGFSVTFNNAEKMESAHLLETYDGIFLANRWVNNQTLIEYVNGGGCIYLSAGTAGPGVDAKLWNTFLHAYGMRLANPNNGISGLFKMVSNHPIFKDVNSVLFVNGNYISRTTNHPSTQLVGNQAQAFFGITDLSGAVIQAPWEDDVIRIDWAIDPHGEFHCNPQGKDLETHVLGSFPGWFRVTNKTKLVLNGVSVQINVNEQARCWEAQLKNHEPYDENNRIVNVGNIGPDGAHSSTFDFKWIIRHAGVRFDWRSFPVNITLTPAYTVSYTEGWGPATKLSLTPKKA